MEVFGKTRSTSLRLVSGVKQVELSSRSFLTCFQVMEYTDLDPATEGFNKAGT